MDCPFARRSEPLNQSCPTMPTSRARFTQCLGWGTRFFLPTSVALRPGNSEHRHYRADLHRRQQRLNLFAINLFRQPLRQILWVPRSLSCSLSALRCPAQCLRLRVMRCHASQLCCTDEPRNPRFMGGPFFACVYGIPRQCGVGYAVKPK